MKKSLLLILMFLAQPLLASESETYCGTVTKGNYFSDFDGFTVRVNFEATEDFEASVLNISMVHSLISVNLKDYTANYITLDSAINTGLIKNPEELIEGKEVCISGRFGDIDSNGNSVMEVNELK